MQAAADWFEYDISIFGYGSLALYLFFIALAQMRLATRPITLYSGSIPLLKKKERLGAKSSIFIPRLR